MNNDATRFDLLEVDVDESPAKDPAKMTANELYDVMVKEGFEESTPSREQDPIEAFRIRMEAARKDREAQEAIDRAARQNAIIETELRAKLKSEGYIAVEAADQTTGAVIYWQLNGDVEAEVLARAWNEAGLDLDHLPDSPSPEVALNRAVKELQSRSVLIRQHPAGGWAIVHERSVEDKLTYVVGPRVYLNKEGAIVVAPAPMQSQSEADADASTVRAAFVTHQQLLSTTDISSALVGMSVMMNAVALRDRGGIYFIPKESIETLHKVKAVFSQATAHIIHEIPAMKSDETVAAIVDALRREAQDTLQSVTEEMNDDMGTRAAANRIKDVQKLAEKVRGYEDLLGQPLGDLQAKFKAINAKLADKSSWVEQLEV